MKNIRFIIATILFLAPLPALAASSFEITGWIPYWRVATGTADTLPHLDALTEVNPFVYTMKGDGTIVDNGKLDQEPWLSFIAAAKAKKVRVIPTIMSGNGSTLHKILSKASSRIALEDALTALVMKNDFDGIDIDFEGKRAEDKAYFSTFLKGLYQRMGKKWVMCTIESRTPIDSRYYGRDIPKDAGIYANDFKAINKYCDRVRIMAYDQQGIDRELAKTAESSSEVYGPVADPRWVRKTIEVAARDINKNKILIGVPTYGYEYNVTAYAGGQYTYDLLWAFNPGYALPIAVQYGVSPQRNTADEMYFTYTPIAQGGTPAPAGVPRAAMVAAVSSALYANTLNSHVDFRLLDWPDAQSIAGKIQLARDLGVRGISIFKLDGGQDPAIWDVLTKARQDIPLANSGGRVQ
jgi:spore germination protein YaaH